MSKSKLTTIDLIKFDHPDLKAIHKLHLIDILNFENTSGQYFRSINDIAKILMCTPRNASNAREKLVALHLIRVERRLTKSKKRTTDSTKLNRVEILKLINGVARVGDPVIVEDIIETNNCPSARGFEMTVKEELRKFRSLVLDKDAEIKGRFDIYFKFHVHKDIFVPIEKFEEIIDRCIGDDRFSSINEKLKDELGRSHKISHDAHWDYVNKVAYALITEE
jgi:hypothetical protein